MPWTGRAGGPEVLAGVRYLLLTLVSAMATLFAPPLLLATTMTVAAAGAGFLLLPRALGVLGSWADRHRRRAGALLGAPVGARPLPPHDGRPRWRAYLGDPDVRRDLAAHRPPRALLRRDVLYTILATPLWSLFPADTPLRLLLVVPVTSWGLALLAPLQILLVGALGWWAVPRLGVSPPTPRRQRGCCSRRTRAPRRPWRSCAR